ncbi:MAG: hypothetical protein PHD97_05055 [Bacteroidales bacterium]|nr:hypothetical protein [Bacteroidales bacterium]
MAIYKFRLLLDDYDDFFRDIEIKPKQTFADFHNIIQETFKFEGKELSSFFLCDHSWRRGTEITLIDMTDNNSGNIMKNCVLANFIEDPHQRMNYVYNFLDLNTIYIELVKIISEEEKGVKYPRVSKSYGELPKSKIKGGKIPPTVEEPVFEEELVVPDENNMEEEEVQNDLGEPMSGFNEITEEPEENQI